jgi:potassium efflux system protein
MYKYEQFFTELADLLGKVGELFNIKLLALGNSNITLASLFYIVFSIFIVIYLSNKLSKFIGNTVLKKYTTTQSTAQTVSTIIRYSLLIIGSMIIVQTAGIDTSTISILFVH